MKKTRSSTMATTSKQDIENLQPPVKALESGKGTSDEGKNGTIQRV